MVKGGKVGFRKRVGYKGKEGDKGKMGSRKIENLNINPYSFVSSA